MINSLLLTLSEIFQTKVFLEPKQDGVIETCKIYITNLKIWKTQEEEPIYHFAGTIFTLWNNECQIRIGEFLDKTENAAGNWGKEENIEFYEWQEGVFYRLSVNFNDLRVVKKQTNYNIKGIEYAIKQKES